MLRGMRQGGVWKIRGIPNAMLPFGFCQGFHVHSVRLHAEASPHLIPQKSPAQENGTIKEPSSQAVRLCDAGSR